MHESTKHVFTFIAFDILLMMMTTYNLVHAGLDQPIGYWLLTATRPFIILFSFVCAVFFPEYIYLRASTDVGTYTLTFRIADPCGNSGSGSLLIKVYNTVCLVIKVLCYICSSLATPIALRVITTAKYVLRGHHWDKAKVCF